jgi:hypothetical protein
MAIDTSFPADKVQIPAPAKVWILKLRSIFISMISMA